MVQTERIRDVIRYIKKFKETTIVIRLSDNVLMHPLFSSHIHDLALLYNLGIHLIIIPGAQNHISQVLNAYHVPWELKKGIRTTTEQAMDFIKMAAFDTSNRIMTALSSEHLNAVIGNWVRARGRGVVDGIDFGSAGFVDKIDITSLKRVISDGFIPILPCVGWSSIGKPYNIASTELATTVAIAIKAEKLFFLSCGTTISIDDYTFPPESALSPEGRLAAMPVDSINSFIDLNRQLKESNPDLIELLQQSQHACKNGVLRTHILDATIDGVIPAEIFSELGAGTMIYQNDYGIFRAMKKEDIPAVLSLMNPFVEKDILLPRTQENFDQCFNDYLIFEIDGGVRACGALHIYPNNTGEIAGLAVDELYAHMGVGPKLMLNLITKAKNLKLTQLFVLTTQTADWFERFGFKKTEVSHLPEQRKAKWSEKRGSLVLMLNLNE